MTDIILILILVVCVVNALLIFLFSKTGKEADIKEDIINSSSKILSDIRTELVKDQKDEREYLADKIKTMSESLAEKQNDFNNTLCNIGKGQEERFHSFSVESNNKLASIQKDLNENLEKIRNENIEKFEDMRKVVDEKLQETLNKRLTSSFATVSQNLEAVQRGLGEMSNIASDVGSLKKVLTNVKQRGILGEIQLKAILTEILSPQQFAENTETVQGSGQRVEFAVKLPGKDTEVYLPIDSKLPGDTFSALQSAYEEGDKEKIEACRKQLRTTLRNEAKEITKYIAPPATTDFAIMFLPFEGLYAEAVNMGMIEELQRDFKINICGPSTIAAFLNSLSLGFKTLAISKRSNDAFKLLSAVKTEFEKYTEILEKMQKKLNEAENDLNKLMTTRTNAITRKLRDLESLSDEEATNILND
ncbi:MAG: DNA recombination protein RmuC [Firmicutes bacterium]|nr:DNA recombination protein RmuC [Bacillota bacterium]